MIDKPDGWQPEREPGSILTFDKPSDRPDNWRSDSVLAACAAARQQFLEICGVESVKAQVVGVYDIDTDEFSSTMLVFHVSGSSMDIEAVVDVKWQLIDSFPECMPIGLEVHGF